MVYGSSICDELKKYVRDGNSRIVFTFDMFQDKFVQIVDGTQLEKIIVVENTSSMSEIN